MAPSNYSVTGSRADETTRRGFFSTLSRFVMLSGLLGSYGMLSYLAGRFVYPSGPPNRLWMFVTQANDMQVGDSLDYQAPSGEKIVITRQQQTGTSDDFLALSSTCPHLGCQVHWQSQLNRYFCPCHNGVFDPSGKGIGGPPGDAGQSLFQYRLKVDNQLLFIEAPTPLARQLDRDADRRLTCLAPCQARSQRSA